MSLYPPAATPTPSNSMAGANPPVCQNCSTSTTPLWRRDESGATLCNACGLFLKLHGRPRPISLKTDVIKSRNRVKSSTQVKRKNLFDTPTQDSTGGMLHAMHARNQSGSQSPPISPSGMHIHTMPTSGHTDGPYDPQLQYAQVYHAHGHSDGSQLQGHNLQQSGGSVIPPVRSGNNPPTIETLLAANSALRTRVTELELVNDLFRSRVSELETSEANSRRADTPRRDLELQLRIRIDELERRENEWRNKVLQLEEDLANKDGSPKKSKTESLKTSHDKQRRANQEAGKDSDRTYIQPKNSNGSTDEPIERLDKDLVHDDQSTTDKGDDLIRAEDILNLQSNLVNGRAEEINSLL